MNRFVAHRLMLAFVTLVLAFATSQAQAQEEEKSQGPYVTQATQRLVKLIAKANADGYLLTNNSFSIGGGWIKYDPKNWVSLYSVKLVQGRSYRFVAAGDNDAKDVDIQIVDRNGKEVAVDEETNAEALVRFDPQETGEYMVRIRLYDSRNNLPCVCLAVVLMK